MLTSMGLWSKQGCSLTLISHSKISWLFLPFQKVYKYILNMQSFSTDINNP